MKKATLNYIIDDYIMQIETGPLYYIDEYTSQYKDNFELVKGNPKRELIYKFIREHNNKNGDIKVHYSPNIAEKEELPVIYKDNSKISIEKDEYSLTDIEKARRLLFTSKDQLFARLFLSSNIINQTIGYELAISEYEYILTKKNGLSPIIDENKFYISFYELIKYRMNSKKLGSIRQIYEEMLNIWETNMEEYNYEDTYYYSRELRLLMDKYNKIKNKDKAISNLVIGNVFRKIKLIKTIYYRDIYDIKINFNN